MSRFANYCGRALKYILCHLASFPRAASHATIISVLSGSPQLSEVKILGVVSHNLQILSQYAKDKFKAEV